MKGFSAPGSGATFTRRVRKKQANMQVFPYYGGKEIDRQYSQSSDAL